MFHSNIISTLPKHFYPTQPFSKHEVFLWLFLFHFVYWAVKWLCVEHPSLNFFQHFPAQWYVCLTFAYILAVTFILLYFSAIFQVYIIFKHWGMHVSSSFSLPQKMATTEKKTRLLLCSKTVYILMKNLQVFHLVIIIHTHTFQLVCIWTFHLECTWRLSYSGMKLVFIIHLETLVTCFL